MRTFGQNVQNTIIIWGILGDLNSKSRHSESSWSEVVVGWVLGWCGWGPWSGSVVSVGCARGCLWVVPVGGVRGWLWVVSVGGVRGMFLWVSRGGVCVEIGSSLAPKAFLLLLRRSFDPKCSR
jgi:hypothetical protein